MTLSAWFVSVMLGIIAVVIHTASPEPIATVHIRVIEMPPALVNLQIETSAAIAVSDKQIECLQRNIFFEARNQSKDGMKAVALVTMNRVYNKYYPHSICDVVYQGIKDESGQLALNKCQFSWACNGKKMVPVLTHPQELAAWQLAGRIAERVLRDEAAPLVGSATHYHAHYVAPGWARAKRMEKVKVIDSHIFYEDIAIRGAMTYPTRG